MMCGIAGVFHLDSHPVSLTVLRAMAGILRHRGPDDEGFALFDTSAGTALHLKGSDSPPSVDLPDVRGALQRGPYNLGLVERRLAILDLSAAAHSPMTTADGALTLVFNGEIYNYVELRTELASLGHHFRSTGDTEVLLAAYRQWGSDCVGRFNGMWAFALWDAAQERLFCSRDRFGVKPFYYVQQSELFAFASEPKALWRSGLVEARPNMTLLGDFLAGYESSKPDASMFAGICQLPGGHSLTVSAQGIEHVRYWSLPCNPDLGPPQPDAGPIARVRQMLIESVRLRLRADVPVGTCLSGGLDSSAIACLANDLMQHERNIPRSLVGAHQKTFTACYDDSAYDERPYAQMVVDQTGAEWHQAFPKAESLLADLDRFLWHHDEPPITTSIYAQWCVMRLVREKGIVVTLDGQGADELLGGYLPYDVYLSQILLAGQAGRWVREARAAGAVGGRPMRDVLARVAASRLPAGARRRLQAGRPGRMLGLSPETAAAASARHQEMFGEESLSNLPRHLSTLTTANLPRLLRSEDRNSMAFSVEARTPFLDVHLAEYISQLPAVYRIHNGWSKIVLRRAVEGIVPDAICWRRDKKGFVTPEGAWLRVLRPVLADVFNGTPRAGPLLDLPVVRATLRNEAFANSALDSGSVWRWTAAELWLRMIGQ